jgi:hypothetical protein
LPGSELAALRGRTEPRLWTPPLRPLTPDTSVGFDQVRFARNTLRRPLLPWQEWAVVHGGELLPDGRPRFRIVLVIVARQNGKTEIPAVITPWWMFVDEQPLILGTSTKLEYAKETWDKTRHLIRKTPALVRRLDSRWYVRGNNNIEMWTAEDVDPETGKVVRESCRYKIAAANEEGGRSLTINRGVADELRQHKDYSAWGAMEPAASPEDAQIWALSNAGDDTSVVLNDLRDQALEFIEWARRVGPENVAGMLEEAPGDYRLGLMEWSAPEDADPEDVEALLQANPRVGYGRNLEDLVLEARRAKAKGGEALTTFQTEKMCINVPKLSPAIDPVKWADCLDPDTLDAVRGRLALCLDMAPDGEHVTLTAAGMLPDSRVRVEVVAAWDSAAEARAAIPDLVAKIKPRVFGWFPDGPAAALAADLKDRTRKGQARRPWPPRGVVVEEIRAEASAACMGLAEQVNALQVAHSGDPLQDAHVLDAEKLKRGGGWVFTAANGGHVDAAYAAAGAVHLARTLPPPVGKPRLVVASDD